ncbi:MAG: RNase 2 protein [Ignavibacteria bacterium]|nr:RNase 2 protein [Ignavibacteria bacterium]
MKFACFDLEIAKEFPNNFGSWEKYSPLGITCAALAFSDNDEIKIWKGIPQLSKDETVDLVNMLLEFHNGGYKIVTWNGTSFDFHVLAQESGLYDICGQLALNHFDMMLWVTFQVGYYLSLQTALEGSKLKGKKKEVTLKNGTVIYNMDGAKAPSFWAKGEYDAVLEYLKEDVRQPLLLIKKIIETKRIKWTSKNGKIQFVIMEDIKTVNECFSYPIPDTSWMKNPPKREDFIKWIPPQIKT